ncbi:MAG: ABC transporter permease, partial [Chloroflexi bacterium]|nr:ABC transporter permease [Chloroflexota bacterium]
MNDILTVAWKEWKELLSWRSSGERGRGGLSMLIMVAVFGVVLPWQMGTDWVESPLALLSWAWVPILLVSSVIAQAFAGERERHTLETLLSTRLSDKAILLGKILAAVTYAWGLTMVSLIVGLVTINVAFGEGRLILYPVEIAVGGAVLTLLVASTVAAAGTLVSLHASTVRQAQQTLSIVSIVLV